MSRERDKRGEGDILEAHVKFLSQIGRLITVPWVNSIELIPAANINFASIEKTAKEVTEEKLSSNTKCKYKKTMVKKFLIEKDKLFPKCKSQMKVK